MLVAGVDAGSRAVKLILWDRSKSQSLASGMLDQGVHQDALANDLLDRLLSQAGCSRGDLRGVVATGYGRNIVGFADRTITEITCHARGVRHVLPEVRTVIDIGGQDCKVIHLDEQGNVYDFSMNDRCAAGSGRFLEMVATRLDVSLDRLAELSRASTDPAAISSMCVVFAETEIVGLLATGTPPEDIVAGVLNSLARRVAGMIGRTKDGPVVFTGGAAQIGGLVTALEVALERPVIVAPEPQMTGALGAALSVPQ
ncbi:MAG: acyl-CoA dehydratase activase [Candidatus Hydrogenedentales bacterium]|jgi:predicted CoA-substrate-specific enzyme activase